MKVDIKPRFGDALPILLYQAHEVGAFIKSGNSIPCSICRQVREDAIAVNPSNPDDRIIREHFHGSDFGSCARKVFNLMKTGIKSSSSNVCFLADGHLHEHSMLRNLEAGLPDGWRIKAMENQSEKCWEGIGIKIIGHVDALLFNEDTAYLIECKAVKEFNFKKIRESGEISTEWYGQMQAYMLMMEINTGYLLVKHRESSKILPPIRIDRDVEFIKDRLNKLKEIYERLAFGINNFPYVKMEQPEREHKTAKDSECMFCPFKDQCWGE